MATTKTEEELIEETTNAIDAYITQNTGVVIQTLSERGDIKYFIDTGAYAMNWAITNDFWKGFPGARTSVIGGECLGGDTKIKIKVDDNFFDFIENNKS